jgi:hypothetical protein
MMINLNVHQVEVWLNERGIGGYTIRPDGTVDVVGNVDLRYFKGTSLPVQFGKVSGYFDCSNTQIISLEGAPQSVGGYFDCSNTKITSLEGAPRSVGGNFSCGSTKITSLEGAPQSVGSDFYCSNTQIISLEGAPQSVGGYFDCSNTKITSLEGAPQSVGSDFYCSNTQITSLQGAPQSVGGNFYCSGTPLCGLLRLLDIQGLKHVVFDYGPIDAILDKYVGTGDILSAQDELIDAGFKDQARM